MSKNFELLQRAGIGLGQGSMAALAAEGIPVEVKKAAVTAVAGLTTADPGVREESLKVVQRLFLGPRQAAPKAVMFAAIEAKNGCSWLCANIAKLLAESVSGSVCLVEGNFRTPSLPKVLGVENHHGLMDALRQESTIRSFAKQIGPNNLWLVSAGSFARDSLNLLNGERMKERIGELRQEFDYLLIDAPPLNAYADGMVLGRLADGVVLVLEANTTRREAALRITESLRATNIPVLGAVLNNRTFPIPAAVYKRL